MDQIATIKERVCREEWSERVRQCSESGLTVSEWCKQNSINPKTYYYHLRKIRKEICEQIPIPVMTTSEKCPTVKVSIADVVAEILEGTSEQMITSVIRAIKNA